MSVMMLAGFFTLAWSAAQANVFNMGGVRNADGTWTGRARYFIPTEDEWHKAAYHQNDGVTGPKSPTLVWST